MCSIAFLTSSAATMGQRWLTRKSNFSGRTESTSSAKYFGSSRCSNSCLSGMNLRAGPSERSTERREEASSSRAGAEAAVEEEEREDILTKVLISAEKMPSEKNSSHSSLTLAGTTLSASEKARISETAAERLMTSRLKMAD